MSQTNTNTDNGNTKQCQDTRRDRGNQGGSCGRCRGNCKDNCGNSSITNYSFEGELKDGCLSNLTITKSRHQSTQLKKILDALLSLCQDKNYKHFHDIISANTKSTQAYFLLAYPVRPQQSSIHH